MTTTAAGAGTFDAHEDERRNDGEAVVAVSSSSLACTANRSSSSLRYWHRTRQNLDISAQAAAAAVGDAAVELLPCSRSLSDASSYSSQSRKSSPLKQLYRRSMALSIGYR